MADEINEDYVRGYGDGQLSVNGYTHAKLMKVKMFIDNLLDEHTKPEIMEDIKNYAEENK